MRLSLLLLLALPLAACADDAPEASGEAADTATPEATSGEFTVADARTAPAPAGQNGGVFLTLTGGATADTLVAARFAGAAETQVHEGYETEDGLRGMREVAGVPVPAGGTARLAPGGYHVMLLDLTAPLTLGDTVDVELEMAQAGTVPVRVAVRPVEEVMGR